MPPNTEISSEIETQDDRRPHRSHAGLSTRAAAPRAGNPSIRLLHLIVVRARIMAILSRRGTMPMSRRPELGSGFGVWRSPYEGTFGPLEAHLDQ